MENAGAVTFGEQFLLFDEKTAPLRQRRAYAGITAHELAHQWVGDLVTAAWWDDIWLNEAFATWVGTKAVDAWDPKLDAPMGLLRGVQEAMGEDGLTSARAVRQPIVSTNDIENAFDSITYQKGGGVLSMFERWVGPETFQRGVHEYLSQHRFGAATADDFLSAVSAAAGKDVKTPFHTFLDQPGVPFVEAELRCDGAPRLHLKQSRFLPLGSSGNADATWQIPVCARYQVGRETKESCTLLAAKEGDLPLGATCPAWVLPNASAAGYFRFGLAAADLARLRAKGFPALTGRERLALGNSLRAAWNRGTLSTKDVMETAALFAADSHREVAGEPMGFVRTAREWLRGDPLQGSVEAYGRKLFQGPFKKLGWTRAKDEEVDRTQLRSSVLDFLAFTARDPAVRAEAKKRALAFLGYPGEGSLHPEAIDANLAGIALAVLGEEADRPLWDAIHARLVKTDDVELRGRLLWALASARSPALVPLIRELAFDPGLHGTEVSTPLWDLLGDPTTREATWGWIKDNFARLLTTVPKHHGQTQLIRMGSPFCDDAHARDVETFFDPARLAKIEGGPRVLATTLETVRLCAVKRARQEPSMRELFAGKR